MYLPKIFENKDIASVTDFINANGFAILVSSVDNRPWATHIPLVLDKNDEGKDILSGHISKANKQWKEFDKDKEVLAIFSGEHAYISSSWYDHENVPTWNYIAVHLYGKLSIAEGEKLHKQLSKLVDKYESGLPNPKSVERMPEELIRKEMRGVIGFEIEITEIQAASKLSQNRNEKNKESIIVGLIQKGDEQSLEMAKLMKENK